MLIRSMIRILNSFLILYVMLVTNSTGAEIHTGDDCAGPEMVIMKLKKAYEDKDIETAMSYVDFYLSIKMFDDYDELKSSGSDEEVNKLASVLQHEFKKHFLEHEFPSYENLECRFMKKTEVNNLVLITEECNFVDGGGRYVQTYKVSKTESGWKIIIP